MVYNLLVAYYYELISSMILIVAFDMYSSDIHMLSDICIYIHTQTNIVISDMYSYI